MDIRIYQIAIVKGSLEELSLLKKLLNGTLTWKDKGSELHIVVQSEADEHFIRESIEKIKHYLSLKKELDGNEEEQKEQVGEGEDL